MDIEQKVKDIISDTFKIEADSVNKNISADNTPDWDSLGHLRLVTALESEFGIMIEPQDFIKMSNYKGVIDVVELYVSKL
jgi:acyl carrier protein